MLHEIASGMIETRHIVTPIRTFCKRSRFYCAEVESIDLKNKTIKIRSSVTPISHNSINSMESSDISLYYDYLVAVGSETRFWLANTDQKKLLQATVADTGRRKEK